MSDGPSGTVWDRVAGWADREPDRIAVRGASELTYGELAARAETLAETIRGYTGPGAVLAVAAQGPVGGAVATLAAARSGCAVLPLSADSPPLHRRTVLTDARPALLLHEHAPDTFAVRAALPDAPTPGAEMLRDAAYVMYTSGSTGRPKGVVVSHPALLDRLDALASVPGLRPDESILAMTALSFDISMAELLLPLTIGASFVAAPPEARSDPAVFARLVTDTAPDVLQATPSHWRVVLAWGWPGAAGSRIWCGGEALTPGLAERLVASAAEAWNVYGPTEATIWASACRLGPGEPVSLGEPLPGSGLFLADPESDEPLEGPGRVGEVLLHGAGLATGYWNRPELTAERFVVRRTADGERTCYRTGDRARYRDDGSLEFLGRTDDQVKLRGHRIELGEIEAAALTCPGVSESAVVVVDPDRPEYTRLALFVVAAGGVVEDDVRAWLAGRLPTTMQPARVTLRDALPRTTAGKVDRAGLSADLDGHAGGDDPTTVHAPDPGTRHDPSDTEELSRR